MKQWFTRAAAAAAAAAVLALPAAAAPWTMTVRDGLVCVVDGATDRVVQWSDVPASLLPEADQTALKRGLPLESRADFTRAAEDFLS